METGQEYDPRDHWCPGEVPEWLLCRPHILLGAKLCFGHLARYVGTQAPTVPELAGALGVSPRQVKSYLAQLRAVGLIDTESRGRGGNQYRFLWHQWAGNGEVGRPNANTQIRQTAPFIEGNVQSTAPFPTVPPPSAPSPLLQEPSIRDAGAHACDGGLRDGWWGGLNLGKALFDYLSRPAVKAEASEVVDALRQYAENGVDVTQEQLETAADAARKWWREKMPGAKVKGAGPFLVALGEASAPPEPEGPYTAVDRWITAEYGYDPKQLLGYQLEHYRSEGARVLGKRAGAH